MEGKINKPLTSQPPRQMACTRNLRLTHLILCTTFTAAMNACAEEFSQAPNTYDGVATVSEGLGLPIGNRSLTDSCPSGARFVAGASGSVEADDGTGRIVPMLVNEGPGVVDMYNDCTGEGDNPDYLAELETVVIDEEGEVVTAHIFGDNYYELYINGQSLAAALISLMLANPAAQRFRCWSKLLGY